MDEAKLALETLIVGVFGLVCILVMVDLVRPEAKLWDRGLALFQGADGPSALAGLFILPFAYVVGAAEFPLADHLFELDSRAPFDLPVIESDDALKVQTYVDSQAWLRASEFPPSLRVHRDHLVSSMPRSSGELTREQEEAAEESVHALYDYQKFVVLKDEDGYRLLKPLYEQVVVLRGTAFYAMILAAIRVFG
ncbi:MAG TPA: hypothetical protein VFQ76_08085, partial [Longimicrobiaceae bacterium]|nr:hypothetical protein [Longimicrobiaceae bacterium]